MSEEIVRRLRNRSRKDLDFLKESLNAHINEADEDEEEVLAEPEEEENTAEFEDNPEDEGAPSEEEEYVDPEGEVEEEDNSGDDEDTTEYVNPLDNTYAVKHTIGDEVLLAYANGTKSKLKGEIDGYDKEGFYRIRWANGLTTNGITDLAIADLISKKHESKCVCGNKVFVTENRKLVCDNCGRILESGESKSSYIISSNDPSDRVDSYAQNLDKAKEIAINKAINSGGYTYEVYQGESKKLFSVKALWKGSNCNLYTSVGVVTVHPLQNPAGHKFTLSEEELAKVNNLKESSDPLTIADKSRPKGKKLIRSEAHPVSTVLKPNISETIRNAFKSQSKLMEDYEDREEEENNIPYTFRRLSNLEGQFWTRINELVEDIEELGYEVLHSDAEGVVVINPMYEDIEYYIPLGGTARTITLNFDRARIGD